MQVSYKISRAIVMMDRLKNQSTQLSRNVVNETSRSHSISLLSKDLIAQSFKKLDKKLSENMEQFSKALLLDDIVYKLRTAVGVANATNGINRNLTELDYINNRVRLLQSLRAKHEGLDKEEERAMLLSGNLRESDPSDIEVEGLISFDKIAELETMIQALNKRKNDLKDQNAEINASQSIAVELTDEEVALVNSIC